MLDLRKKTTCKLGMYVLKNFTLLNILQMLNINFQELPVVHSLKTYVFYYTKVV